MNCGILVEKLPSDGVHNCPHCGLSRDQDQNVGYKYSEIKDAIFAKSYKLQLSVWGAFTTL